MAEPTIEILRPFLCNIPQLITQVTISKSKLGGRGLFATKFLQKGTLLFSNKPVIYGPRANCAIQKFCSNCYQINDLCYPCEKCYLFVCSEKCNTLPSHEKTCIFICENWKLKKITDARETIPITLARVLIYLRFLLLPEEQKILLNLFQRSETESKFEELDALLYKFNVPEQHVKFMKTVNAIIKVNSFRISRSPNDETVELRGFFPLSAFMNHSCVPNTRNVFGKDYSMAVYASKDIEKGDEITCSYTGLLWCSPARRCQLYKTKNFWCKCYRCKDETEMGTKLSALKCSNKECMGVSLPQNPLNPQSNWYCDMCLTVVSIEKINILHSVLGSLVGTLKLDNEFCMDNDILKRLATFIPYSNHIFVDIRLRLALKLGISDGCTLNGIE